MPLWGWLLVFFGGILLVGFILDRLSNSKQDTNSRQIQKHVDEVKRDQTDFHHFL
ncbi:hypothetical protein [Ferdinandcohnia sp. Marseille-Q9671]